MKFVYIFYYLRNFFKTSSIEGSKLWGPNLHATTHQLILPIEINFFQFQHSNLQLISINAKLNHQ